jgi:hypothetical protein
MGSKSKISRKNFIKSGSAFLSLLSVGMAGAASATTKNEATAKGTFNEDNPDSSSAPSATRRGSWVQKSAMQKGDIGLITSTVKCSIVVDAKENTAVQQAARFLAADMEKITGYKPAIVNSPDDKNPNILISTLANKDSTEQLKGKAEAYRIETKNNNVLLVGSDFRGTAFAVYALCERLGIDPLYHWTGYQPQKVNELVIKKTTYYQDEPTFKYRGFFHDDEDVLPRPFDKYGYPLRIGDVPLEWYQRFFETTLRLGMNMTAPYVRVHRRYEVQKCASDWGLYFTSHHYDILLSNPFGIERFRLAEKRGVSTDWDWYKNKDNMIKYWRGGVEENKDLSAVWPVGLRGTDDHAYEFPQGTSEQEQAAVFRDAIDVQVKTVKQLGKEKNPAFHFTLYTEMLEKFQKHRDTFSVPDNVILVWPDDNEGLMRGLPDNKGKWKHGVYYHLAYYGNVVSKQGPHVVSPYRVADEFKKIVNAGATEFLLVNVTEMREFIMEARMIAEICWDKSLLKAANTADNYVNWWANEYFGSAPAASIFNSYQQYYKLYNTPAITWFANDLVQEALDKLHQKIAGKKFAPIKAETLIQRLPIGNSCCTGNGQKTKPRAGPVLF